MHIRNSNQALLKRLVRRVTSPGNLFGRKNISVADKFVAMHLHTHIQGTASHIHTGHGSPYTYRLLSVRAHTYRPLQSAHIQATDRTHIQATAVRTHTGYWAYAHTHTGHCSTHTYRLLIVHTYRPLQSAHIQATDRTHIQATAVRTHTVYWAYTHTGHCSPHTYRLLPSVYMCKASMRRTKPC